MNGCSFQQVQWQNLGCFLSQHRETRFLRGFISKPTERAQVFLKNSTMDFQNSPLFERSACFYVTITGNVERFQYFNFETHFLIRENFFQKKKWSTTFQLKVRRLERQHYQTPLPMLRQRMRSTKWSYHKERSFARNQLVFFRIFVSVLEPLIKS